MKSVLSVDVAKGKSMVMLSTEYGEVLTIEFLENLEILQDLIIINKNCFLRSRSNNHIIR